METLNKVWCDCRTLLRSAERLAQRAQAVEDSSARLEKLTTELTEEVQVMERQHSDLGFLVKFKKFPAGGEFDIDRAKDMQHDIAKGTRTKR